VFRSARQSLHSEWSLRGRCENAFKERSEEGDDIESESGRMDFTKLGENIAELLKQKGVVLESQLDITCSIDALERISAETRR
jgi:hypothetical protein